MTLHNPLPPYVFVECHRMTWDISNTQSFFDNTRIPCGPVAEVGSSSHSAALILRVVICLAQLSEPIRALLVTVKGHEKSLCAFFQASFRSAPVGVLTLGSLVKGAHLRQQEDRSESL